MPVSAYPTIDEKACDRLGGSTANIENPATQSDERQKTFEPCSFEQLARPFPVPRLGVPIVKIDDVFCVVGHPYHVVSFMAVQGRLQRRGMRDALIAGPWRPPWVHRV